MYCNGKNYHKLAFIILIFSTTSCQIAPKVDRSTMTVGFAEAAFGLSAESQSNHTIIKNETISRWNSELPVSLEIKGENKGTDIAIYSLDRVHIGYYRADDISAYITNR